MDDTKGSDRDDLVDLCDSYCRNYVLGYQNDVGGRSVAAKAHRAEKGRVVRMTNKEMADFLSELRNRHEMPIDEDEYDLLGSIVDDLREWGTVISIKDVEIKEPICKIIFDIPYYFCGNCKTMLNMYGVKAHFCSECGCAVNWGCQK